MPSRSLSFVLLLAAIILAPASAQLSGNYTVDNSMPTGGGNYNTLIEAAAAVTAQGVSGPVTFALYTGSGSYVGFGIVGAIAGSSATNTVTFTPAPAQTPVISGPAPGNTQTIRLGNVITANTGPANIVLVGLTITGAATGAGIFAAGCNNITIQGCTIYGTPGQTGSGIQLALTPNSVVRGCEIFNVGMTAGTTGTAIYSGGISLYQASSNCTIAGNKVHDCTGNGIHVGASAASSAASNVVIVNNFVWNCPGSSTYPGGISTRRTPGLVLSNNSVLMASGANGGISITATDSTAAAEVSNNVVRHLGTGGCFDFEATGTLVPTVLNFNLYEAGPTAFIGKVGTTGYATLAAWQAVATPNLVGKELNTLAGATGFISASDLHITPLSAGFNNGSTVAAVTVDIDGQSRGVPPSRGADEISPTGIYANFSATPASGPAPLNVTFTDLTFTSDPSGVQSWAWDFQNDGINDAFTANPSFNYVVPGTYSVKLTVTDLLNGSSNFVATNYITVGPYIFDAQTNVGTGDLTIYGIPGIAVPTATTGYMFVSFAPAAVLGQGPFFGLIPDANTWSIVTMPAAVGNPLHFVHAPGVFPALPFYAPPGSLSFLIGVTVDFVQVDLTAAVTVAHVSNCDRVTF